MGMKGGLFNSFFTGDYNWWTGGEVAHLLLETGVDSLLLEDGGFINLESFSGPLWNTDTALWEVDATNWEVD